MREIHHHDQWKQSCGFSHSNQPALSKVKT